MLLAQAPVSDEAIRSAIDGLQRIYTIILALAIGEAFKQFVADKADKPQDRHIHWNRVFALVSFLLLVVPFYHGMVRYFFDVYSSKANRPSPYSLYLSTDCVAFTTEAAIFFVLSRSLSRLQWRRFYWTVFILLVVDIAWGLFTRYTHNDKIMIWVFVNIIAIPAILLLLCFFRNDDSWAAPALGLLLVLLRTAADYWSSWDFYFPS